ncbi:LysR family transcriptional regulator [Nocardiopsis akebiae]|uniref:LysR family transcriptional regulator n=1 Tax=Nocardiopsis akebiae TaxID=2831968 RepID=A0ABX8C9Q8_9ACTN|nr:LysR family transcriptional regulator [Nocardiopsis akebiae]QUX30254.1 LysR family transcriptional regulator [Nocardiopsis akebiae]
MDLSLRQLSAYAAVARYGSFTRASRELRVAQPSLSRTVLGLERALGVRLLERTTRRVECTPEGAELLAVAERLLEAHRSEMNGLERFLRGERGTVAVATLPSVAAALLPSVISRLRSRTPEADVHVLDGMSEAAVERLQAGECDLALVAEGRVPGELVSRPLLRDRYFAVVPVGHPFAERAALTWADLAGEAFLATGGDSSVRAGADAAFERAGVVPERIVRAGNVSTIGGLVSAGIGVTALPALVGVLMSFADHVRVPLTDPVVDRGLSVLTRRDRRPGPVAAGFLSLLEEMRAEDHPLPRDVAWTR